MARSALSFLLIVEEWNFRAYNAFLSTYPPIDLPLSLRRLLGRLNGTQVAIYRPGGTHLAGSPVITVGLCIDKEVRKKKGQQNQ